MRSLDDVKVASVTKDVVLLSCKTDGAGYTLQGIEAAYEVSGGRRAASEIETSDESRGRRQNSKRDIHMSEGILKGQWKQRRGGVRQQWGKLTDDDVAQIKGDAEVLPAKIQEHYGRTREQAEKDVARWLRNEGAVH